MATTSGQAGRYLCVRSAVGLAGLDFQLRNVKRALGGSADPADLVLGGRMCAPPLLQRIVADSGTSYGTSRKLDEDIGVKDMKERIGG